MTFRIGSTFRSKDFSEAPRLARQAGYDTFQTYLGPAELVYCVPKTKETLETFKEKLLKYHVTTIIHGSYTINLCHPVGNVKRTKSINALVSLLKQSDVIGKRCLGVIIHMGKNMPENKLSEKQSLETYAKNLQYVLSQVPGKSKIVLETGASQGNEVGSRLDRLGFIYRQLTEAEKKRVRFCIDTCHVWASGYDISNTENVNAFFEEFHTKVGGKIVCIHFNNSMNPLNSHVDRHADLTHGQIPYDGLKAVAQYAKEHSIALITETPLIHTTPEEELAVIHGMINKK